MAGTSSRKNIRGDPIPPHQAPRGTPLPEKYRMGGGTPAPLPHHAAQRGNSNRATFCFFRRQPGHRSMSPAACYPQFRSNRGQGIPPHPSGRTGGRVTLSGKISGRGVYPHPPPPIPQKGSLEEKGNPAPPDDKPREDLPRKMPCRTGFVTRAGEGVPPPSPPMGAGGSGPPGKFQDGGYTPTPPVGKNLADGGTFRLVVY